MKTVVTILSVISLVLLMACERQLSAPVPAAPPAEPAVAAQAVEPPPPVVVVSQEVTANVMPTTEVATVTKHVSEQVSVHADIATNQMKNVNADTVMAVKEQQKQADATKTATPDVDSAEPAPIFNLAGAALDPAVLKQHKVEVTEEGLHALTFGVASVPLALTLEALPVGAAPRTLIAAVKTQRITRDATPVMYGRTDDRQLCAFSVNHRLQYSFWGFGADLSTAQEASDAWVVLAFSYDGTTGKLYVNGGVANSASMTLKTEATPLILGGRSFVGSIAGVRVYKVALADKEIAKLSTAQLTALAGK